MLALDVLGIAVIAGCAAGALVARGPGLTLARRRRMARHPSPTFVFADLVGYTSLTEQSGDQAAADVAREFRRAMSLLSREHGAWHVKSMGDGAMIWVPDAGSALRLVHQAIAGDGARSVLCCREEMGLRGMSRPVVVWRMAHNGPSGLRPEPAAAHRRAATTSCAAHRASSSVSVRGSRSSSPA
jgi:hypothetical protein